MLKTITIGLMLLLLAACGGEASEAGEGAADNAASVEIANREIDTLQNTIIREMYPQPRLNEQQRRAKARATELLRQSTESIRPELVKLFRARDVSQFAQSQADVRARMEAEFAVALEADLAQEVAEMRKMLDEYKKRRR
ncbi:MAG: hypothetical protein H6839_03365 [Planctomycetes bacterium]|nr:hypothetical protein [Planctomycetota bacterium]